MKIKALYVLALALALSLLTGCTRIATGEVGLRVGFDNQIDLTELLPGSFNQTIIGNVLLFPTKDVAAVIDDMQPVASDNSTMKDVDVTVIYNISPSSVGELYSTRNRSFHAVNSGETYLMYNYIAQAARNAAFKVMRKFDALTMNDARADIETNMKAEITRLLADEKLIPAVTITQVQVRSIKPADTVVASANDFVRAQNQLKQKEVEVRIGEAEAKRMAAISNVNGQSIAYMQSKALLNISEGIKDGKVHTVVVPADFKGLLQVGK